MKLRPIQTNFSAGEISPRVRGRMDLEKYFAGASIMENFKVHLHGGATRRAGTHYVANTKSDGECVLVGFEFNTEQTYILEFGNTYIRFYRDGFQIESGGSPYEIVSPYSLADVQSMQVHQEADTLWIVHPDYQPRTLTRTAHTAWTLALYAPTANPFTGADDYPSCVTAYQQRLIFGGTNNEPHKIWSTVAGDYFDMTPGTNNDDAWEYGIVSVSGRVPVIKWLEGSDKLLIGAAGGEYIGSGTQSGRITPTDVDIKVQSTNGCEPVQPRTISNSTVFIQRGARKVRNFKYELTNDRYNSEDVSILSEHITIGGLKRVDFQSAPDPVLWFEREDGQLIGLTYEPVQDVTAWHRHRLGNDGLVESMATIANATGEEIWCAVKHTVNGSTVRHVVYMDSEDWRELPLDTEAEIIAAMEDCFYLDYGLTYDGVATDLLTGADHLEGMTVGVLANGAVHPDVVVTGGEVQLQYEVTKAHVGIRYRSTLRTMPVGIAGGGLGTMLGRRVGWGHVDALLYLSGGGSIQGEVLPYRVGGSSGDAPPALFSGNRRVPDLGYTDEGYVTITTDDPLPFTVLALAGALQVNE